MHCPSISDHFQVPCYHLADWWLQTWAETAQSEPFKAKNTNVSQTRQLQKLEAGHKWGRQTETTARGDWAYLYKRPKENPEPTQNRTALTTETQNPHKGRLRTTGNKPWKYAELKSSDECGNQTQLKPEQNASSQPQNSLTLYDLRHLLVKEATPLIVSPTCYTCRGVMGVNYLQKPEMFVYQAVNMLTHRCLCWTLEKLQV